jgi:hypothetical protein
MSRTMLGCTRRVEVASILLHSPRRKPVNMMTRHGFAVVVRELFVKHQHQAGLRMGKVCKHPDMTI